MINVVSAGDQDGRYRLAHLGGGVRQGHRHVAEKPGRLCREIVDSNLKSSVTDIAESTELVNQ